LARISNQLLETSQCLAAVAAGLRGRPVKLPNVKAKMSEAKLRQQLRDICEVVEYYEEGTLTEDAPVNVPVWINGEMSVALAAKPLARPLNRAKMGLVTDGN